MVPEKLSRQTELHIVTDRQLIKDVTFVRLGKCLSPIVFFAAPGIFLSVHEVLR